MAKPTVAEHRADIRGILSELAAVQFTDAELDANLKNALNVLSGYVTKLVKVNKAGLSANALVIDLTAECPPEAVVEVIPSGLTSITSFRPRGVELVLNAQIGATSADFVYRGRYTHDGTDSECSAASSGRAVTWGPPMTVGTPMALNRSPRS